MDNSSRERAIEAFWLLNDFIGDLITGTRAFEYFDTAKFKAGATDQILQNYNKMVYRFIFSTLAKWIEFYDHYRMVIPPEQQMICKQLRNELVTRGVKDFRNKVVGHIWSTKQNRPLFPSEIENLEKRITGGDGSTFLKWINDPGNNRFGTTIVGTSEAVRDELKKKWVFSEQELLLSTRQ
jgi:hypothetical protein